MSALYLQKTFASEFLYLHSFTPKNKVEVINRSEFFVCEVSEQKGVGLSLDRGYAMSMQVFFMDRRRIRRGIKLSI